MTASPEAILAGEPDQVFNDGRMRARFHLHRRHRRGCGPRARAPPAEMPTASGAPYVDLQHRPPRSRGRCRRSSRTLERPARQDRAARLRGRCSRATCRRRSRRSTGSRAATGFAPTRSLDDGLARFVEWYREYYACRELRTIGHRLGTRGPGSNVRFPTMILVTGGARLHRRQLRARLVRGDRRAARQSRQAARTPATSATCASLRDDPRHMCSSAATSATARWCGRCSRAPAARDRQFRRGDPRRPLDPRSRRVHRDQRRRHVRAARRGARDWWSACRRDERARVPLPARVDRRGLRLARTADPAFCENDAVRAEQPAIPRRRPRPITWCARITTRTGCRR